MLSWSSTSPADVCSEEPQDLCSAEAAKLFHQGEWNSVPMKRDFSEMKTASDLLLLSAVMEFMLRSSKELGCDDSNIHLDHYSPGPLETVN